METVSFSGLSGFLLTFTTGGGCWRISRLFYVVQDELKSWFDLMLVWFYI